jgi:hypothetical protein
MVQRKENKLTITWNFGTIFVYACFWVFIALTVLFLSVISPLYIIIGFCVRGLNFADRNFIRTTLIKMRDWHDELEAYLTKDSAYHKCKYYVRSGQKCTSFLEYFHSVGFRNKAEYDKYNNIKCLFPVNCYRCERIREANKMEDRINNKR